MSENNENSKEIRAIIPIIPDSIIKGAQFNDREAPVTPESLLQNADLQLQQPASNEQDTKS